MAFVCSDYIDYHTNGDYVISIKFTASFYPIAMSNFVDSLPDISSPTLCWHYILSLLSLPHKLKPLLSANPNIVSLFNNSPQTITISYIVLSSPHRRLHLLPRRPVNPWIKLLLQPVCLSVPLPAQNKHTRWLLDGRGTFIPRCHVISLPYSIQFLSSCCSSVLASALLLDDWLHVVVSTGRFVCLLLGFVL